MKISCISDLHLHYNHRQYHKILREIKSIKADVLVLAGDIDGDSYFWETVSDTFEDSIFVLGNHDYWLSNFADTVNKAKDVTALHSNINFLENSTTTIKGQEFFGATMWYSTAPCRDLANDSYYIADLAGRRFDQNKETIDLLHKLDKNSVVVTHHMPSYHLVDRQFKDDELNQFFVCDILDKLWQPPKLWFYGHTHVKADTILGRTRCYCNPIGYYTENTGYSLKESIEI